MIHVGDCLAVMRTLGANSFDSIVTDPPYGLGFMGKQWDDPARLGDIAMRRNPAMDAVNTGTAKQGGRQRAGLDYQRRQARDARAFAAWTEEWAAEALRIAKPGAYLAAFGGTRMFHRLMVGIEDAGWEIRDTAMWVYGSGFPKSHNGEWGGTALKPAWEPIALARKPLDGTVEANWRKWGTGALNIDGCRVAVDDDAYSRNCSGDRGHAGTRSHEQRGATDLKPGGASANAAGRWPANLIHDGSDEVLALFPREAGASAPVLGTEPSRPAKNTYGEFASGGGAFHGDAGSAARFFYCAKASRADRNDGLEGMPLGMPDAPNGAENAVGAKRGSRSTPRENVHPTVKPTDLMRWLCRLVTPTGGRILDPFAGSGSTGRGAIAEGFQFEGIELDPNYARIAEARIRAMHPGLALGAPA